MESFDIRELVRMTGGPCDVQDGVRIEWSGLVFDRGMRLQRKRQGKERREG